MTIPLEAKRVRQFVREAIETHHEAAQLKGLLDLGCVPAIQEGEDDEIELHLVHPDRPDTLRIAAIDISELMVSQN